MNNFPESRNPAEREMLLRQPGRIAFFLAIIAVMLLWPPPPVSADVYRYIDEQGTVHFTNVPDQRKFKLWFREKRVILKPGLGSGQYDDLITGAAARHQVDEALIKAVIRAESNFNHRAVSPKGARGLMQLMPETASILDVKDSFEPGSNIDGGVRYLRYLINAYSGQLSLALAAYNAGEKSVARYGGIPPYTETRLYVRRVLDLYDRYRNETAAASRKPPEQAAAAALRPGFRQASQMR